ncbi:MAG: TonB-dependent receptor, partial [Gammaproteobacteria bacterium]|nr:TonB-dependent receptor [Gammaproteobacteria bacterium]
SHKGVELSLGYQINDDWSVSANNTYARHLYENDILISNNSIKGNIIDTAPKHISNARLDWRYSDSTNWQLEYDYLGNYFLNPDNSASYEGHQLWHLRGVINFDKTQISLRITNLTDEDYAERADFGFGQHRYFIGLPRSISVGIKYLMD